MKVAVLFYGQPRFIENQRVLNTYKNLIRKYDADVFCHVWWEENGKYETSTCSRLNPLTAHKNAIEIIKQNYNPKIIKVDQPSMKFNMPQHVKEHLDIKFTNKDVEWTEYNYERKLSHLYSIQTVSRIFEKYEDDTQQKYDWIILARYDVFVKEMVILNHPKLPKNKFYLSNHHPNFPDLLFCYSRKFCEWSSNVYDDVSVIYNHIRFPTAEEFKMRSFYKRFGFNDMIPSAMACEIIRN